MTLKQGAAEAEVKIRTSRVYWMLGFGYGLFWLVLAIGMAWLGSLIAVAWLAFGVANVAKALWLRTVGVDLTPGSAILRGRRPRSVPWQEVQAVVHHRRRRVRAGLPPDWPVVARAPGRVLAPSAP